MKEHPILFSGSMVAAILAGRKAVTRRVIVPQPTETLYPGENLTTGERVWMHAIPPPSYDAGMLEYSDGSLRPLTPPQVRAYRCPFGQPGSLLWVRETWAEVPCWSTEGLTCPYRVSPDGRSVVIYRQSEHVYPPARWRPSIHMPRWASRLTLRVTDVRPERVTEIDGEDAQREGTSVECGGCNSWGCTRPSQPGGACDVFLWCQRDAFRRLWNDLNTARGYGWERDPWVWRVAFEVTP